MRLGALRRVLTRGLERPNVLWFVLTRDLEGLDLLRFGLTKNLGRPLSSIQFVRRCHFD
jgi:hypothetical protein